jgi:LAO/AO transport system kinase
VGKSSLIGALVRHWRGHDKSVAVIAVDPSSPRSGGALLGDRTRLAGDPHDARIFVRSMATRGRLGGVSLHTYPALVAMRAFFELVVIETVGVGQSEIDVRSEVDTVVLCVQPGSGDTLQFMKAGIGEIPDLIVVTKSDVGAAAQRALGEVSNAAGTPRAQSAWYAPPLAVSARNDQHIADLCAQIERHRGWLAGPGRIDALRESQALAWVKAGIRERWGQAHLQSVESGPPSRSPFELWQRAANLRRGGK